MKNFRRVLMLAAQRRLALFGILLSSLVVSLLWAANFGILYPVVEVVFNKDHDSLSDYATAKITEADEQVAALGVEIEGLNRELATADETQKASLQFSLDAKQHQKDIIVKSVSFLTKARPYIEKYTPSGAYETLLLIIGFLVAATTIKLLALGSNLMLVQYVTERTSLDLRNLFFRKALHLDLELFGDNGSADLTSRLTNDVGNVCGGIGVLLGRLIREPLKMITCLVGAAYICPRLLLLVMLVTPIVGFVMHHLSRAIRRASRRMMEEMSQVFGLLNNSFAGIRVVKAFNTQGTERAKFKRGTDAYFRRSMKMGLYNMLARSSSEMLGICTVSMAILAGGYLAMNGHTELFGIHMSDQPLGAAEVLTFFALLIGASDPAKKLTDVWSGLQRGIAAADRVYAIIDKESRVIQPETSAFLARPHGRITFKDVSYKYPSGPRVLRGIDLTIRHGETIAVVGPNGCGKSTLISLLCRFDDPESGDILLDDVSVNQLRARELRKRIALVTQRTVLFDDTIEENIRYGTPGADDHAVVRAAKLAFADEFIRHKTPDGYKTKLGVNGMRLSGGQQQRIALARAFLRDPDILILDEATSQIDLESEQLIHQALAKFLVDRTGIMITHRPTSLAMADRIVVVEAGEVVDEGVHAKLINRNRFYQSLCGSDFKRAA